MKVLNIRCQQIPACVKLPYRGFEISLSTIFSPPTLAVFLDGNNMTRGFFNQDEPDANADNIRAAMEGIDKLQAKVEAALSEL